MSDLPDRFPVEIINWDYADQLCQRVSRQLRRSGVELDAIVGIARGGWFPARCLADRMDIKDLFSLTVDHYTSGVGSGDGVRIRDTLDTEDIRGQRVLLVDDSIDTGRSMRAAVENLSSYEPAEVEVAVLQVFDPPEDSLVDFSADRYPEWRFVVNPWEFTENMVDIVNGVLVKEDPGIVTVSQLYELLEEYHEIRRSDIEMVKSGGIEIVLDDLVVRNVVTERHNGWELLESGRDRYRNRVTD